MEEEPVLTKKQRRLLAKEKKRQERAKAEFQNKVLKSLLFLLLVLLVLGASFWFYRQASKPLPGITVEDIGRRHVPDGTVVEYNSNPPTSGSHYEEWTPAGVYDRPISDGHLVHSLEHGYVIISYNCESKASQLPWVSQAFAHEEELGGTATEGGELEESVWESQDCQELKEKLASLARSKRLWKIIVIPRPSLDTRIALTAWGRIDKFDTYDEARISAFIDAFRDKGPEKTVE